MPYTPMLLSIIVLSVGFWLFARYLFKQQVFLDKPKAEQQKIKKKLYWSVYGGFAFASLLMLLVQNGITLWLPYLVMCLYLLIWIGGIYLLWLAYVIGIHRDVARIKKQNGELFKHPEAHLNGFALTNLLSGCAVLLIAIMIPLQKIDIKSWWILLAIALVIRNFIIGYFEKSDNGSGN